MPSHKAALTFVSLLLYYGSYKGAGAIFGLFCLFFITIPIRLIRLLLRVARQ
jgi:hypothetical protein